MPAESDQPIRPEASASHRPASMTLRGRDGEGSDLDPANQSLADALALIFRLLQYAMFVLVIAFVFSGFSLIGEAEKGVTLLFGRETGRDLPSGFKFSAPYPLGEMIKVDVGKVDLPLDDSFFPRLTDEQKKLPIQLLAQQARNQLKPGEDGSLLTGDSNLAHARWSVSYRRDRASDYARHVLPDHETAIVRAAVERGVVQAVAQVTIDDLLKQSSSDQGSVATRAREIAQQSLDTINSGITIDQLALKEKAPPLSVYADFSNVQSSESNASGKVNEARAEARNRLNSVAGEANKPLTDQIDAYEQAIARGDTKAQESIRLTINALLEGKEVKVADVTFKARLASGEVTNIVNEARQYRSSVVSRYKGEIDLFQAKLAQFKSNPNLVLQREWADAMGLFLNRPQVEIFNLPPGAQGATILINRDQDWLKEAQEQARLKKDKEGEDRRRKEQAEEVLKTRTDVRNVKSE